MTNLRLDLQRWEKHTEWPLAAIAVVFLVVYSVQILGRPDGSQRHLLWLTAWLAWGIFVVDYLARLYLAPNRLRWFLQHWFELAIVALPLLRPLRLLRLVVLLGALQKAAGSAIRGRILTYTLSAVILLIYVASLAILTMERNVPGAKIDSFGNAVWWSITTVTTIGYGDLYPVTVTGRCIAVALMIGGISLVGVVTASIASWIVQRVSETETANQAATAAQIEELRDEVRALAQQLHMKLTG